MPEEIPNGLTSQIKPFHSIEMKNSGITIVSNCFYCSNKLYTQPANEFKLFKAPNSKNHISLPVGQRRIFSLKGKARPGDKENPIIAEDGYEEESKSDIAQKETENNLLDELDKVTKNISTISFDSLGSPIASDKGKISSINQVKLFRL